MRLRLRDEIVPYPLFTIKGRLKLSGLNDQVISEVMKESVVVNFETEDALLSHTRECLESYNEEIRTNFDILTKYEYLRGENSEIPAIVVILEGASATGKSLIALELMRDITATRFISTDSIRVVLRGIMSKENHPELFCHTYQAYTHRQSGPADLDPIIRGFLAQYEIMTPHIELMIEKIVTEGAIAVVEGVHILPGRLQGLSPGVIEILVNPDEDTHKAMFVGKQIQGKLRTVSGNISVREKEFEATRAIQRYMVEAAEKSKVPILELNSYGDIHHTISACILSRVRNLLSSFEDGVATK